MKSYQFRNLGHNHLFIHTDEMYIELIKVNPNSAKWYDWYSPNRIRSESFRRNWIMVF